MKDSEIWEYAKNNDLTIITKDDSISSIWNDVLSMSKDFKLVRVYTDTIEGVG